MTTEQIVKVDAKEYGLEEVKAKEVEAVFLPMIEKMSELEGAYNEIVSKEISQALCAEAKDLRLKYVKIRTGTAAIHKTAKAFYLAGGRFVDGWKNAQLYASQGKEEKLKALEDHYTNIERERIAKLQSGRETALSQFEIDGSAMDLGNMAEDVWIAYRDKCEAGFKAVKEAEAKVEADRIAKEKSDAVERARIEAENARLRAEADAREKEARVERDKADAEKREAAERVAKAQREKKALEEKLAKLITCPNCNHEFELI